MCHTEKIDDFGELLTAEAFAREVDGLRFGPGDAGQSVAVLPDIYGLTDFYKGYASYLAKQGAQTWLTNPWAAFGDLPEMTREAAYERRQKLRDSEHCDQLEKFLANAGIDTIVGFCIGGNFAFELAKRGYQGTIIAVYPLPWGMANDDALIPAFDYMPALDKHVTIFMGAADHLAGPANIDRLKDSVGQNNNLDLHLYPGSNHGFLTDLLGEDDALKNNALDAIDKINRIVFAD